MQRSFPPADPALDQDAVTLHEAVSALVRVYQFRDRDRICCYDISVTQCQALKNLVDSGPMRAQALAETLFLDKSTTSRVLEALERKAYIARQPDPTDGRAQVVTITNAGRALFAKITDDLIDQQRAVIEDLDPEARRAAIEVVTRLHRLAEARFTSGVSVGPCSPSRLTAPAV